MIVEVLGIDAASRVEADLPGFEDLAARFSVDGAGVAVIDRLIKQRDLARAERRFEIADQIREALEEAGVMLEDGPDGTRWLRR